MVGLGSIRVREVERPAVADFGPAHARDAAAAQADGAARHKPEPRDTAVLLRPLESELEAEADAEDRPPALEPLAQLFVVAALAQPRHRRARRADAGEHGDVGAGDVVCDLGAEPAERDLDRAHIARPVSADRGVHIVPLVDGTPSPERAAAAPSARPTALNAASATWCGSRPVASTWMPPRAACARLPSMCPAIPGSCSSRSSAYGRPPRSTDARARASSIGTSALP